MGMAKELMTFTLKQLNDVPYILIKEHPAHRLVKNQALWDRLKDAWVVFRGNAIAVRGI